MRSALKFLERTPKKALVWLAVALSLAVLSFAGIIVVKKVLNSYVRPLSNVPTQLVQIRSDIEELAAKVAQQQPASENIAVDNTDDIRKELRQMREMGIGTSGKLVSALSQTDRSWIPPQGSTPASIRLLPYPFMRYFSIASDVDGMTFPMAESIYRTLATVGLPFSDSSFMDGGPNQTTGIGQSPMVDILTSDEVHQNLLARWVQSGLIDTYHGLFSGYFLRGKDFTPLTIKWAGTASAISRNKIPLSQYFPGTYSSHFKEAPLELLLRYEMPFTAQLNFRLVDESGRPLWTGTPTLLPNRIVPTTLSVPMKGLSLQKLRSASAVTLEIDFQSGSKNSYIKIYEVGALDRSRARVEAAMKRSKDLNITIPVFSHHGMPPGGALGLDHLHALPDTIAWQGSLLGDSPNSPIFWIDLLDKHGTEFIGRDTSVLDKAPGIKELTYPYLFNDGRRRYSFHRIFSSVRTDVFSSHEPGLADQISGSLRSIDDAPSGSGGLLYTHWGVPFSRDKFAEVGGTWPLSQPTIDAFRKLSGRYYGWDKGKRVPANQRIWIAPSYRQLVYSVVRRQIEPHVFLGADKSSVHIRHWMDSVTERVLPGRDQPTKRLQGITVYVEKSALARAFVEDIEIFSFTRNPRDETGRESITFVDNSTPTLVFDEIDLQQQPGKLIQRDARLFPISTDTFAGKRAMEVITRDNAGFVEWEPEKLSCEFTDAFQFAVRKGSPAQRISITLTDQKNQKWQFFENELKREEKSVIGRFEAVPNKWSLHTFRFATLDMTNVAKPQSPFGLIKSIRFSVEGGPSAKFDKVACLRENPLDDPIEGFRVSGRIHFAKLTPKPTKVEMNVNGVRYETTSSANGVWAFKQRVPRDSLVMVKAIGGPNNDVYMPAKGRVIQVTNNIADLDIVVSKNPHPPDLNGSVPSATIASGQFLPGVGPHYRPGSRFSSTGLSEPTEYRSEVTLNNLGYIDREHRVMRMSPETQRIMILGACNLWGHTESLYYNTATVMETLLRQRTGKDFEVMNLSTASQHAGVSWFYYNKLGRAFRPDIVFYELIGPLDVGLSHPHYASIYNMTMDAHLPSSTFRPDEKGGLIEQFADQNFSNFRITDPAIVSRREKELKKNAYIIDGVNFMYLFHRDPSVPFNSKEQVIEKYYAKLIAEIKKRFDADGVRVVFLVTDHFGQGYVPPALNNVAYHRKNFDARMDKLCADAGVECLRFVPNIEKRFPSLVARHWRRDSHYSRVGYRWYAEEMVNYLVSENRSLR